MRLENDAYCAKHIQNVVTAGLNEDTGTIVQYPNKKTRDISGTAILDNHGVNMVTSAIMAFLSPTIALAVWANVV